MTTKVNNQNIKALVIAALVAAVAAVSSGCGSAGTTGTPSSAAAAAKKSNVTIVIDRTTAERTPGLAQSMADLAAVAAEPAIQHGGRLTLSVFASNGATPVKPADVEIPSPDDMTSSEIDQSVISNREGLASALAVSLRLPNANPNPALQHLLDQQEVTTSDVSGALASSASELAAAGGGVLIQITDGLQSEGVDLAVRLRDGASTASLAVELADRIPSVDGSKLTIQIAGVGNTEKQTNESAKRSAQLVDIWTTVCKTRIVGANCKVTSSLG